VPLPSRKRVEAQLKEKYNITFKVHRHETATGGAARDHRRPNTRTRGQKGTQPRNAYTAPTATEPRRAVKFDTTDDDARPAHASQAIDSSDRVDKKLDIGDQARQSGTGSAGSAEERGRKGRRFQKLPEGQQRRLVLERLQTHMRVAAQCAAEAWEAGGLLQARNAGVVLASGKGGSCQSGLGCAASPGKGNMNRICVCRLAHILAHLLLATGMEPQGDGSLVSADSNIATTRAS
jgi:hypothetical protein